MNQTGSPKKRFERKGGWKSVERSLRRAWSRLAKILFQFLWVEPSGQKTLKHATKRALARLTPNCVHRPSAGAAHRLATPWRKYDLAHRQT